MSADPHHDPRPREPLNEGASLDDVRPGGRVTFAPTASTERDDWYPPSTGRTLTTRRIFADEE